MQLIIGLVDEFSVSMTYRVNLICNPYILLFLIVNKIDRHLLVFRYLSGLAVIGK